MLVRTLWLIVLFIPMWLKTGLAYSETLNPVRLVVMIEGQTQTGKPVMGAGLIVGRLASGEFAIATAKHVVETLGLEHDFALRFFDQPELPVAGRILHRDFGRNLDLAVVAAVSPDSLHDVDFAQTLPMGRLTEPVRLEELVSFIGQTEGERWNATSRNQMVTGDQGNSVRVNSPEAGPGVSGGVAIDGSDRIVGIALTDDQYVISVLKLSVIETQLRSVGVPFSLTHGQPRIVSHQDYESGLRAAFRARNGDAVTRFPPSSATVPIVDILLDEPETLMAFARNMKGQAALSWLSTLISHGFDPNRLVRATSSRSPLLLVAFQESNVPLVITLLENGASPYIYQELWGNESEMSHFLFPLEVLRQMSLSDAEKAQVVQSMVRAGLTITEHDISDSWSLSRQKQHVQRTQHDMMSMLGVDIPMQNEISRASNSMICEHAQRDGYDWCALIERLPSRIEVTDSGWHPQFTEASLVKPLVITNGYMYVMTFSKANTNANEGYGLMRISKDANELVWYRFVGSGAGLGLCEELRRLPIVNHYRYECWRRQVLLKSGKDGIYTDPRYEQVTYRSVR